MESPEHPHQPTAEADTFTKRVLMVLGLTTLAGVSIFTLIHAADVFFLLFASILFAIFLRALTKWLMKVTRLERGWALTVVLLSLLLFFLVLFALSAPSLARQFNALSESLPKAVESASARLQQYEWGRQLAQTHMQQMEQGQRGFLGRVTSVFTITLNVIVNTVLIFFLGLFLASTPRQYLRGAVQLLPQKARPRAREVLGEVGETLKNWLIGQFGAMVIAWIFTTVGLWILGVPLAPILGLFAGMMEFIPNFGPIIAAVPAMLLGLAESPSKALQVAGLYVGFQMLSSYTIQPLIQSRMIALPAAVILFTQILLGTLLGFGGLALATPFVAAGVVIVRRLYVEDTLGDVTPLQHEWRRVKTQPDPVSLRDARDSSSP